MLRAARACMYLRMFMTYVREGRAYGNRPTDATRVTRTVGAVVEWLGKVVGRRQKLEV